MTSSDVGSLGPDLSHGDAPQLYRWFFDHSAEGVVLGTAGGAISRANPAACRMLGYGEEDLREGSRRGMDALEPIARALAAGARRVETERSEALLRRPDGSTLLVSIVTTGPTSTDAAQQICVLLRDRSGEAGVAITPGTAEGTGGQPRETGPTREWMESLPAIAWRTDENAQIIQRNRHWFEFTGRSLESASGTDWLEVIHPDDRLQAMEAVKATVCTGGALESEFRVRRADGVYRWFLGRALPVRDGQGRIMGWMGLGTDIEDRKRAEQALREADQRKNEFLGVLSHELRNPLAPIRNAIHILDRAPDGSDQASRAKAVIERQTNQLSRLVDDLLDVTRISRGKVQLRRSRVELTYLLRQVVEDHRPTFASRNVALTLRIDARPQWIDADATRIEQVIGNLLQNAAKFTNAHGHVAVRVGQDGPSQAVIHVTDDGIGIAPDMLGRVFEPFTQADDSLHRGHGGLGLGLALAKGLVEMHGGRVEAHSRGLGKGTEFTISLPLLPEAGVPLESLATASATAERLRVLVIEDNLDAAVTLKEVLEMSGHEVAVAHDGHGGVAKARSFKPDVVLCDIGLPGLDGYEVARQIRADPSISPMLIALTGYARPEDQRESFKAGFDHHLAKPILISELEQVLATATSPPTSRRILVVDDNDALRSNIRELLEDEGWEVREARDGKEAMEAVAGFHPAVMLLDYRLPEMDGGEVLRRLGAIHAEPRVVLMTASTEVREIAMQHGLRFYVPKPFRSDDLLDTVEHARSGS
jgi:PAS domain S-box-containing protein